MSFDKESEGNMPTLHNFSIYAYLSSWQQMTSKIQLCLSNMYILYPLVQLYMCKIFI